MLESSAGPKRKGKDPPVESNEIQKGNSTGIAVDHQRSIPQTAKSNPNTLPASPKHHALGQQPRTICPRLAPSAQRIGDFLRARGGARQKQIGDVRAGDEMDENDRAHDEQRERLGVPRPFLRAKSFTRILHAGVRRRMLGRESVPRAPSSSARAFSIETPFLSKPTPRGKNCRAGFPSRPIAAASRCRTRSGKRQSFGMTPIIGDLPAVDRNLPADDGRIAAEEILPDVIAEQRHRRRVQIVFLGAKLRPRIGCTPRNEKVSADRFAPRKRSGLSPFVMMKVASFQAPKPSSVVACFLISRIIRERHPVVLVRASW